MIRILLVCPLVVIRTGLRVMLEQAFESLLAGWEVQIWETGSLVHAPVSLDDIDILVLVDQDQALFDYEEWVGGTAAMPAFLLLTDHADVLEQVAMLEAPAWGVMPIDASEVELVSAVLALSQGLIVGSGGYLNPVLSRGLRQLAGDLRSKDFPEEAALTGREIEVLELLAQGLANKQIALALGITENTVKFHVSAILTKLGAGNRLEAVRIGVQRGLISL